MASVQLLPADTIQRTGFTHKAIIKAADVTALTKATQYGLFPAYNSSATLPAGSIVEKVQLNVTTLGTNSTNTLTLSVGDSGSATRFINAVDLKTVEFSVGASIAATPYVYTSASNIRFQIDTDAANLSGVGALVCEIYMRIININLLEVDTGPLGS